MSLRTRLFLAHTLVILLSLGAALVTLLVLMRDVPDRQRQVALLARAEDLADFGRLLPANEQPATRVRERLTRFAGARRARVLVTDSTGVVQIDTANNISATMLGKTLDFSNIVTERGFENAAAQAAARNAPPPGTGAVGTFRDGIGRRFLFGAVPSAQDGAWLVISQAGNERQLPIGLLDDLTTPLLRALIIALAVSALAAVLMARSIARPVRSVAIAARAVAAGRLDQRVAVSGPPEIQQLAADFNTMTERVRSAQQTEREFMTNVTHELKTPLTSIQGFAQAIRDGDAPDTTRAAGIIYDESARLQRLVNDLLDSARIESGATQMARQPVDIAALLRTCAVRFEPRAVAGGVTLAVEAGEMPLMVTGDGDRLLQVFTNLVDNALKHVPVGGKVTLTAQRDGNAQLIVVSVTDSGSGITADDLPHIFDRFYQADKSRGGGSGAGLGLAIARQIVEANGGVITAQSIEGVGTRMTVRLAGQKQATD
jgi:signal transduction histidine kinase